MFRKIYAGAGTGHFRIGENERAIAGVSDLVTVFHQGSPLNKTKVLLAFAEREFRLAKAEVAAKQEDDREQQPVIKNPPVVGGGISEYLNRINHL